jgi:hypothetical protein
VAGRVSGTGKCAVEGGPWPGRQRRRFLSAWSGARWSSDLWLVGMFDSVLKGFSLFLQPFSESFYDNLIVKEI